MSLRSILEEKIKRWFKMDNYQLINLAAKTTDVFLKNTTETIFKRIDAAKDDSDKEKTILRLEEIIKELIE